MARAADDGEHPFSHDMPVVLEPFELLYALRND